MTSDVRRSVTIGATLAVACVVALAVACAGEEDGPPPAPTASLTDRLEVLCARPGELGAPVTLQVPEAVEISGMAASRRNAEIFWAHNDSGDSARVFAFTAWGEPRGVFTIDAVEGSGEAATAIDWEAMAIGPGADQGADYLYLGDIGDNAAERADVVVYRVPEPEVAAAGGAMDGGGALPPALAVRLRYPDTPHDAETLLADPLTGAIIIVTKEIASGDAGVYVASREMVESGGGTMVRAGEILREAFAGEEPPEDASVLARGVGYVPTDGSVSPDGRLIVLRTYAGVWVWPRYGDATLAEALSASPCEGPSVPEPQGEAIAFVAGGDGYVTVSEGSSPPLHRFGVE